jgi:hypothetical protein
MIDTIIDDDALLSKISNIKPKEKSFKAPSLTIDLLDEKEEKGGLSKLKSNAEKFKKDIKN